MDQQFQPRKRGFAAMAPEKRQEIASLGGKAAHQQGRAHKWTPAEASKAGIKGHAARGHKLSNQEQQA